ncbi:protein of unknown function [Methylocaldum szegediense]|uniref:Uncharacterized protein n=1 Tax=Methylocaldum szegediense TaxID=73780 RepID=A0ABN8X7X6_9GAMM|nr:protein of unknown function [Methylocaldum szegediense]
MLPQRRMFLEALRYESRCKFLALLFRVVGYSAITRRAGVTIRGEYDDYVNEILRTDYKEEW